MTNVLSSSAIQLEQSENGIPLVSTLQISQHFGKKHKHVLDTINVLRKSAPDLISGPKIRPAEYLDGQGKPRPCFLVDRDIFSLLAMGFTGKAALEWKIRYIEAFNVLEAHALELAREAGYRQGLESGVTPLALEAAEKQSWLKGFKEGGRKGRREMRRKDGLSRLERALPYLQKGLTLTEAARLIDCPPSTLRNTVRRLRRLPVQTATPTREE